MGYIYTIEACLDPFLVKILGRDRFIYGTPLVGCTGEVGRTRCVMKITYGTGMMVLGG